MCTKNLQALLLARLRALWVRCRICQDYPQSKDRTLMQHSTHGFERLNFFQRIEFIHQYPEFYLLGPSTDGMPKLTVTQYKGPSNDKASVEWVVEMEIPVNLEIPHLAELAPNYPWLPTKYFLPADGVSAIVHSGGTNNTDTSNPPRSIYIGVCAIEYGQTRQERIAVANAFPATPKDRRKVVHSRLNDRKYITADELVDPATSWQFGGMVDGNNWVPYRWDGTDDHHGQEIDEWMAIPPSVRNIRKYTAWFGDPNWLELGDLKPFGKFAKQLETAEDNAQRAAGNRAIPTEEEREHQRDAEVIAAQLMKTIQANTQTLAHSIKNRPPPPSK